MARKYYIKFGLSNHKNAGSKAMRDVMQLLDGEGYRPMPALPVTANKVLKLLLDIPLLVLTVLCLVRRSGTVLYVIPSNSFRIKLLYRLHQLLGFRLLCFINDIEQLRMPCSARYAQEEMASIAMGDVIMAPNWQSVHILQTKYGIRQPMVAVGVWDYLSTYQPKDSLAEVSSSSDTIPSSGATDGVTNSSATATPAETKFSSEIDHSLLSDSSESSFDLRQIFSQGKIAYAGNLRKSPFIQQLGALPLSFDVWGDGGEGTFAPNVSHQGAVTPYELPPLLHRSAWGLVWDGPSLEGCEGQLGEYLRFNNAHKCGLYLASGLPLIVWKESGMASFVREHGVGICVESLHQLPQVLQGVDWSAYRQMRESVERVGERVRRGCYFLDALHRAERKQLTLLWRRLQPMEAGKDVVLTPYYLGDALDYHTSVVCGYDADTLKGFSSRCLQRVAFVHRPLGYNPRQRIPVYLRYLLTHARQIDLLLCFHRKPETLINLLLYRLLNWQGKVYVKLDTEQGAEWNLEHKRGLNRLMMDLMNRLFLSCCDVVSCETKPGYAYLTGQSPYARQFARKLVWLPNAFDDEALREMGIKELDFDEKEKVMLTVGRLGTEQKNTGMLLRALERVELKDWTFYLVGQVEASFQPEIDDFFRRHPEAKERVIVTGPILNKAALWQLYNRSRLFVLTSTWESYGIVLSEAQRFHNYLVTTEVGDASTLVHGGRYGTLLSQNDHEALAATLQSVVDGKLRIDVYAAEESLIPDYSTAIRAVSDRLT